MLLACSSESLERPDREVAYIEQDAEERIEGDWALEPVSFEEPISFGNALEFQAANDRLFVYDFADMNIKRYAPSGELEVVYGTGRGEGPGELQNIMYFYVRENEEVWVLDSTHRAISRFASDGTFIERFGLNVTATRIIGLGEEQFAVQAFGYPELYTVIDEEGEELFHFGEVIDEPQERYFMALDGFVFPYPDGGFVYAPFHASYLFFFDEDGGLWRQLQLIDRHEFPIDRIRSNPTSATIEDVRQPDRTLVVSFTNEEIIVSTLRFEAAEGDRPLSVLDRYERASGQYIDSKYLPESVGRAVVHDEMVYASADTTLRAFRIER